MTKPVASEHQTETESIAPAPQTQTGSHDTAAAVTAGVDEILLGTSTLSTPAIRLTEETRAYLSSLSPEGAAVILEHMPASQ